MAVAKDAPAGAKWYVHVDGDWCLPLPTLSQHRKAYRQYVERLLADVETWCDKGEIATRPVSTVHFGGGTPDVIGWDLLEEVVTFLQDKLAVTSETQWAVETAARGIGPSRVEKLRGLGFRRLHVGVQTLQAPLRKNLGECCRPKRPFGA